MPDPEFTFETKHKKIDTDAYGRLVDQAIDETIESMLINLPPGEMTRKSAKDCASVFVGSSLEEWVDEMNLIRNKPTANQAPPSTLQAERLRLIRVVRKCLRDQLFNQESTRLWREARRKAVDNVDYAVFRVQTSSVFLHRIISDNHYDRT